ncbi:nucleoside ABC transporter membrane protein [Breoghania corrubedonensis]|uniref:Nucleoside ABC transporter membrane protein n=1 Tax=Breoghania corrubedonensis TaxID=665038 RepID=A0A2T5VFK6_9HYPH|nr:ABC transporter permease [Breoghania corrubedonensis]PTW62506.1 nucleoside ABC transporter membrane protein [Breoghania corrubedonensis]
MLDFLSAIFAIIFNLSTLDAAVRLSTPLLLAALAGLFSERSGIFDIGLEGKMLAAAFAAGAAAGVTGSAWLGLAAGVVISIALALVHGFASITARGNQIVSGVAINFFAAGLTVLLGQAWFHQGGRTPQLGPGARFGEVDLPGADVLKDVPVIGDIYNHLVSGHNILVYAAFLAVPFSWWVLYRTRFGLRLRAVGENPAAVDTAGISVAWLRYRAVICTGILCGLAGTYLSIAQSAGFNRDMTAGRGFIALAALIFAKWKPVPAMFACLLFGMLDAVAIRLQGQAIPGVGVVPVQFFQALPYILTVILLAGFIGKAIPPKAGGVAYVKERT